jgi:squalene-associated FAD-dependent desaturase
MPSYPPKSLRVAIVGGGLAGLAAGCALAEAGFSVSLVERRPYLGGRASSYQHPGTGEVVDNCQHVLLGCCTNLVDLYRRTGVEGKIRWYDRLVFLEPGGRESWIGPSFLPAPWHNTPSFLGTACLGVADKISIARAMSALMRRAPVDNGQSFQKWLEQHGATHAAVERFWKTVLISALNEDLDRVSLSYAALVIRESFMKSAAAGRMGVPIIPLSDLYRAAGDYIQGRGGEIRLRTAVEGVRWDGDGVRLLAGGTETQADYLILATPFDAVARLLPENTETNALRTQLARFSTSPIVGIHFWFDRQITPLDNAVLLDRTIQWMFHKSKVQENSQPGKERLGGAPVSGSYVELVVSAAKSLVGKPKGEIEDLALAECREFFPEARAAQLVKSTVIKEVHATFSPEPGGDTYRPVQATPWPRVFLAGDWTATGWPATMEGAVRSGYLAAQALAKEAGAASSFLVPDLPAQGLMQFFD